MTNTKIYMYNPLSKSDSLKTFELVRKTKIKVCQRKDITFSFLLLSKSLVTNWLLPLSWKVLIIFRCVIWRKGRSGERSVVTGTGRGRRIRHGFVELLWNRTDIERLSWSWNWWKYMVYLSMWSHQGRPYCEQ